MPQLCPDAKVEAGLAILDCCGACSQYPGCLYLDPSVLQCEKVMWNNDESGFLPWRCWGLGEMSGDPSPVSQVGDMDGSSVLSLGVELCQWVQEPVSGGAVVYGLCQRAWIGPTIDSVSMTMVRVFDIWSPPTGKTGFALELICYRGPLGPIRIWLGSKQGRETPVGQYTRESPRYNVRPVPDASEFITPPMIDIQECNQAP